MEWMMQAERAAMVRARRGEIAHRLTAAAVLAMLALPASARLAIHVLHYDCQASSRLHRIAIGGPYDFMLTVRVELPDAVRVGEPIVVGTLDLNLDLPETLITRLRSGLEQERVGGTSDTRIVVDGRTVAITGLLVPTTPLPAFGGLRLTTSGTVAPQSASIPGSLRIEMPSDFTLRSTIEPGVWGTVKHSPMDCTVRSGTDRLLGVIAVLP
jgi:hypothetical protein